MLISAPRVKNMMPTMIMAAPSRKQSRMLGETGGDAETEHQHDGRDGQGDGLQCSSNFSRSLGMDDLIMMSTSLSRPEAVPPGVGIEKYSLLSIQKQTKVRQQKSG